MTAYFDTHATTDFYRSSNNVSYIRLCVWANVAGGIYRPFSHCAMHVFSFSVHCGRMVGAILLCRAITGLPIVYANWRPTPASSCRTPRRPVLASAWLPSPGILAVGGICFRPRRCWRLLRGMRVLLTDGVGRRAPRYAGCCRYCRWFGFSCRSPLAINSTSPRTVIVVACVSTAFLTILK